MRTKQIAQWGVVAGLALLVAGWCAALVTFNDEGQWPDTWPEELDALRAQARTVDRAFGLQETVYEIPFTSREEFEAAWPHILAVKSKGAPLTLTSGPPRSTEFSIDAGVRIHAPAKGGVSETPDGKRLEVGPPWPDDIKSETGVLPEYVTNKDGKWVVADPRDVEERRRLYRARVDIELVVDGMIVDLNRIRLPADTPIIDRRFKKKATPSE